MLASQLDLREVQRNQSLAELAEKEMGYILSDLSNIATQAALIAGFVYSSVADPAPRDDADTLREKIGETSLVTVNACTVIINLIVVTNVTFIMTSGPYKALTGGEETLWRTLRSLKRERQHILNWFWLGLASFFLSLIASVYFGTLNGYSTIMTIVVSGLGLVIILKNRRRIAADLSPAGETKARRCCDEFRFFLDPAAGGDDGGEQCGKQPLV